MDLPVGKNWALSLDSVLGVEFRICNFILSWSFVIVTLNLLPSPSPSPSTDDGHQIMNLSYIPYLNVCMYIMIIERYINIIYVEWDYDKTF